MDYTTRQKVICENIVTIHETGKLSSKSYGTVTNVPGDSGGLTYGKHQVAVNSGGLYLMLNRYCQMPQAKFGDAIAKWLPAVRAKQAAVIASPTFRDLLVKAGDDPAMIFTQDGYFDDQYWKPALAFCDARGLNLALALAVVYDSEIHGSLYRIDKQLPKGLDTKQWIGAYIVARRNWFATNHNPILQRCTYRMDTFKKLLECSNFTLDPVVLAHGVSAEGVEVGKPPQSVAVPGTIADAQRILDRGDKGQDVIELQSMLLRIGYNIGAADGVFGKSTEEAVKAFQTQYGLTADGIVGPATWRELDKRDD